MTSIKEIAKSIIAELEGTKKECNPFAAEHYRRLSIIDYSTALRESPRRSREENERVFYDAYVYAAKAVFCGCSEDKIDESFRRLRDYWLPRLGKEKTDAEDRAI